MEPQIQESWRQLQDSLSLGANISALKLSVFLVLGGFLAIYIRMLYRRCSPSPSDSESIDRVFPLLTLVTIGVIAVVKSSLALSLGLVGALSIVRFRAAIKEPEELVYLFLCIAVGLALGAEQPLLAVVLVVVATLFIAGSHVAGRGKRMENLTLTITGDSHRHFQDDESGVLSVVDEVARPYRLQRFEIENGRGQVRIVVSPSSPRETAALISRLRQRLPECEFSYVNMNQIL